MPNGTDALQVVLMSAGLKPGDEVISPAFTFIATIEVISLLGLKPVIVDVDPGTFNLSPEAIEKAITPKTKAIIRFIYSGNVLIWTGSWKLLRNIIYSYLKMPARQLVQNITQLISLINLQERLEMQVVLLFSIQKLRRLWRWGAIFTNDTKLADMFSSVVNHGMKIRYYHDIIGVNSRLDSIQAAILNVKLKYLDHYILARQKVAAFYDKSFSGNPFLSIPEHFQNQPTFFISIL